MIGKRALAGAVVPETEHAIDAGKAGTAGQHFFRVKRFGPCVFTNCATSETASKARLAVRAGCAPKRALALRECAEASAIGSCEPRAFEIFQIANTFWSSQRPAPTNCTRFAFTPLAASACTSTPVDSAPSAMTMRSAWPKTRLRYDAPPNRCRMRSDRSAAAPRSWRCANRHTA